VEPRDEAKAPSHGHCQTDNVRAMDHIAHLPSCGIAAHDPSKEIRVRRGKKWRRPIIDRSPFLLKITCVDLFALNGVADAISQIQFASQIV
jgi:hypothetical protein